VSETRACAVCGKAFTPRSNRHRYCSVECKNRASYERIIADPKRHAMKLASKRAAYHAMSEIDPEWRRRKAARDRESLLRRTAEQAAPLRPSPVPSRAPTPRERLRIGALVDTGRATAWDLAKKLRTDVADVLRMRDEWRRWRDGVETMRAVRA